MANVLAPQQCVDTEHLFVLEYRGSEQVFGKGAAVSVALELEYEAFFPGLRVLPPLPRRRPSRRVQHRRMVLGLVVVGLLILLALPIRAIGGHPIAGSAPAAGQVYVVQNGDTLTSIARQVAPDRADALVARLAAEAGSSTIVPGEHLLIP
jgi:LysM domain